MPGIAVKWPVRCQYRVAPWELDCTGAATDAALERWVDETVSAYLARCAALDAATATRELAFDGARLDGVPESVSVVASVHEVRSTEFVMSLRVFGTEASVRAACLVRTPEVTRALRDELIAIERDAAYIG
jgi:hypothetical protein